MRRSGLCLALSLYALCAPAAGIGGEVAICGDVTADGRITVVDAQTTLVHAVSGSPPLACPHDAGTDASRALPPGEACGDFDCDHRVLAGDALGALLAAVGREVDLRCPQQCAAGRARFVEVTEEAGVAYRGVSWGSAWGDFDGDGWPDLWVGNHQARPSLFRNRGDGTFEDIIAAVWSARPNLDTHAAMWGDFDKDGDEDLIELSGAGGAAQSIPNQLFVSEDGIFTESSAVLGVDLPLGRGRTPLWLDWDGDSHLDLIAFNDWRPEAPTTLFRQTPTGFVDITQEAGLGELRAANFGHVCDLIGDVEPELLVHGWRYPQAIHRIGDALAGDLTASAGLPTTPDAYDAAVADFDGNGLPDLFVARDFHRSDAVQLSPTTIGAALIPRAGIDNAEQGFSFSASGPVEFYLVSFPIIARSSIAIGAGSMHPSADTFTLDPADEAVAGVPPLVREGMGSISVGYEQATGRWHVRTYQPVNELFVGSRINSTARAEGGVAALELFGFSNSEGQTDRLWLRREAGFEDATTSAGLDVPTSCRSVAAADFDNDMDVDLYLVCSARTRNLPNVFYENQGDGSFVALADAAGAAGSADGLGDVVTVADYDRDGFVDLFVTNGNDLKPFSLDGPSQLFRNAGNPNHWLEVDLVGGASGRDAVGASVGVVAGGREQRREVGCEMHNAAQNHRRLHFGLGAHATAERVTVRWPSGAQRELTNVASDQILAVEEAAE